MKYEGKVRVDKMELFLFLIDTGIMITFFIIGILLVVIFYMGLVIASKNRRIKNYKEKLANQSIINKKDFIANISHDIRAPLNAIIGVTEIAYSHIDNPESLKNDLSIIDNSSIHLLDLINLFLDLTKIENGKMILNHKPVNIKKILEESIEMFSKELEEKNITIKKKIVNKNYLCYGDALRIKQIFINLISNAYKYTANNGTIYIGLSSEENKTSSFVHFIIRDTGCGMSEEFVAQIFEPYARNHDDSVEGTGLGTCIVKHLVELMNGEISVFSKINKGTTFDVVLVLDKCEENIIITNNQSLNLNKTIYNNKRILIVDDEPINRLITKNAAVMLGISADEADNAYDAIQKLKNEKPYYYDFIVMDVRMPKMNGYDATKKIRHLRKDLKKIPILAMTADAFNEDIIKAYDAGMNDHMAKPLEMKRICEKFREWIEKGYKG